MVYDKNREPDHLLDYGQRVYVPHVEDYGVIVSVVGDDVYAVELETSGQVLDLDLDDVETAEDEHGS